MASDVEGFTAAAATLFIRVAEGETRLQLVLDEIHLGAEDEHRRLGIDQDGDAVGLDDLIELALLVGIFERVGQPRAAARAHPDADAERRLAALDEQCPDPLRRGFSYRQCLHARHFTQTPYVNAAKYHIDRLLAMWRLRRPFSPPRRRRA